jgi:hypothetical protein
MNRHRIAPKQLLPELLSVITIGLITVVFVCGIEVHPLVFVIAGGPLFYYWYNSQEVKARIDMASKDKTKIL